MKEWRIRQQLFHSLLGERGHGDDLGVARIIEETDPGTVIRRALEYPRIQRAELYYPGKSFAVAISFAKLLEIHFGEPLLEALNEPMLLAGNDPYFRCYSEARKIYDPVLARFPWELIMSPKLASPDFQKTMEYFEREFLLHPETRHLVPASS
jgi:hypothetical protein